jgi:hypothetical protein
MKYSSIFILKLTLASLVILAFGQTALGESSVGMESGERDTYFCPPGTVATRRYFCVDVNRKEIVWYESQWWVITHWEPRRLYLVRPDTGFAQWVPKWEINRIALNRDPDQAYEFIMNHFFKGAPATDFRVLALLNQNQQSPQPFESLEKALGLPDEVGSRYFLLWLTDGGPENRPSIGSSPWLQASTPKEFAPRPSKDDLIWITEEGRKAFQWLKRHRDKILPDPLSYGSKRLGSVIDLDAVRPP